jgi:hypothetical protein
MAMDDTRLEQLLNEIITDRRYIEARDSVGNEMLLATRSLTPAESNYVSYLARQKLREAKTNRLLTEKETLDDCINKGIWSDKEERQMKLFALEIKQMEKQINPKTGVFRNNKGKKHKTRIDIIKKRKELDKLIEKRERLLDMTVEAHVRVSRNNYYLSRCITRADTDEQLWPSIDNFESETDGKLINSIVKAMNNYSPMTQAEARSIARSPSWSIVWRAAEKGLDVLFNRPSSSYTIEQITLVYWSLVYDSAYESLERPSDKIIENDELFDEWLEDQRKERSNKSKQRERKSSTSRHPEQFVVADNLDEADQIYEENDSKTLAKIRQQMKQLDEADGPVSDFQLRQREIILDARSNTDAAKAAAARRDNMKNQRGWV